MLVRLKGNFIRGTLIRFMVTRDASTERLALKQARALTQKEKDNSTT